MKPKIVIIDYGLGNLLSVKKAFENIGAEVEVTDNLKRIIDADRLVLPGVGAFPNAMIEINNRGLAEALKNYLVKQRPLLGICLGMQLLLDESEEFTLTKGLGLIPGQVVMIPVASDLKIPHVGWASLNVNKKLDFSNTFINEGLKSDSYMYFVHSFMCVPTLDENLIATYSYGENEIPAIIGKDNIFGCQFHPEKSGKDGLLLLKSYLNS